MPQKPNQALLELLSATWNDVVSRGNQHTNWLDMLMTFFTGQREVCPVSTIVFCIYLFCVVVYVGAAAVVMVTATIIRQIARVG